jgi:uncharacterized protein (DUF2141 family)
MKELPLTIRGLPLPLKRLPPPARWLPLLLKAMNFRILMLKCPTYGTGFASPYLKDKVMKRERPFPYKSRALLLAMVLLSVIAQVTRAQNVEVTVTGIRSDKGQIAVGVFTDNESFRQEKALLEPRFSKDQVTDGTLKFSLTLEPGVYGLSVLDDENSDGLMEYRKIGIPKEGFGFSDFYLTGFAKPVFDDFKFSVVQDEQVKLTIRMKYF